MNEKRIVIPKTTTYEVSLKQLGEIIAAYFELEGSLNIKYEYKDNRLAKVVITEAGELTL